MLDRMRKRLASGLDVLSIADCEGAGSLYKPDSSSSSEAAKDRLSSNSPSTLPPNETRSLAAAEGCWSRRVKRAGVISLWQRVRCAGLQPAKAHSSPGAKILCPAAGPWEEKSGRVREERLLSEKKASRERREERLISPQC